MQELYSLGVRNVLVGGLPPMGCLPIHMTAKFRNIFRFCLEHHNKDSVLYNEKLQKLLPQIEASLPGSKFLYADVYNPMMEMIQNPSKYGMYIKIFLAPQVILFVYIYMIRVCGIETGFKETKRGCCGTGFLETSLMCNVFSPVCQNRSEFLFFDSIHPSEATYNVIGNLLDPLIRGKFQA